MFTDGRYIYIASQWAKEKRSGGQAGEGDDDDDVDDTSQEVIKPARYGINIYDPLKNFDHVRGVELKLTEQEYKSRYKKNECPTPINLEVLNRASFATNGSFLVIQIPSNIDKNSKN